ncbi:MAG: dynamin family protein [Actinomycetota bacterium]|nr:dynamin family protein [Actinomycetota bacterium]
MPDASSLMSSYSWLKTELLDCIDEMLGIEGIRGCPCEELREKIGMDLFNLVVVGQFKRGKTSVINALLGAEILPVAVVPLTSIATIMTYGEALRLKVYFNNGRVAEIRPENLHEYVTEKGNPKNIKDVSEVIITYPSPYLKNGVRLIDTPGVGSIYQHNTDVAYRYLPKSDAALFLLSVDQPMGRAELDFLKDVKEYSNKIFFLLNKADYLNEKDLAESIDFTTNGLKEIMGQDVRIFPVSARLALEGKTGNSPEALQKSRLPEFAAMLNAFLMEEKGKVIITVAANNLLKVISQARFELELETKSLTSPLEDLQKKIGTFEAKKQEVLTEKQDFDILLDGETKRIIKTILDEDLEKFKNNLIAPEQAHLEAEFAKVVKTMSSKELRTSLEQLVISHVKQAFNVWHAIEDERLSKAFEAICRRFAVKIDETVDGLLKFSSDLFEIPFAAVKSEAFWTARSDFYYKFKDQPVGLEMLTSSLTLALPKFIAEKLILRKMKAYLSQVIDIQSGRAHHDFSERLDKSKLDFRWEMLQKIEATMEGISAAIQTGISRRAKGEEEVSRRKEAIALASEKLKEIGGKLDAIKAGANGKAPFNAA